MKKFLLLIFVALIFVSCASMPTALTDPHLTWTAPTTNCDGTVLVGSLKYNVYAVSGVGPIPTSPTPNEVPCGILQLASGTPLNSTPISVGTSFDAIVADGTWTFAVEAVSSSGNRSELSNQVTKVVSGHPGKVTNLVVTLNADGSLTIISI